MILTIAVKLKKTKRINESNLNRILNEFNQNSAYSNSINLLNELKF